MSAHRSVARDDLADRRNRLARHDLGGHVRRPPDREARVESGDRQGTKEHGLVAEQRRGLRVKDELQTQARLPGLEGRLDVLADANAASSKRISHGAEIPDTA